MFLFVFDRVEDAVGTGENPGFQHVLLFKQCFQKASSSLKPGIVWYTVKGKHLACVEVKI